MPFCHHLSHFSVEKVKLGSAWLAAELSRGSRMLGASLCSKWGVSHLKSFHLVAGSCPPRLAGPTLQTCHRVWASSSSEGARPASTSLRSRRSAFGIAGGEESGANCIWGTSAPGGHMHPATSRKRKEATRKHLSALPPRGRGRGWCCHRRGRNRQNRKPSKGDLILDSRPGNSF